MIGPAAEQAAPAVTLAQPLLDVANLSVTFAAARTGPIHAVRGVSFTLEQGECLAIVGESGSGKSVTARTLVGLTGDRGTVTADHIRFDDEELTTLSESGWRAVRGRKIGLVLQDALVSLDPLRTVAAEIAETLRTHRIVPRADLDNAVHALLTDVGIPDPARRARQYPHQLSGGLRQRVLIASAIAARPRLLIADEPTTALDVTVQAQILTLLDKLKQEGTSLLLISHDLAVVARLADRIAVMHDGEIVEQGPTERILTDPQHTYTRTLISAAPSAHTAPTRPAKAPTPTPTTPLLEVDEVSKRFRSPDGTWHDAVAEFSLRLTAGETLGIVGESGSGKTTAARIILGLIEPDAGTVRLVGKPWSALTERERRPHRRTIQAVYQDPLSSFDPRHNVAQILGEAVALTDVPRPARRERIAELLEQVGLDPTLATRRPRQLSGGQRQRVAIARALAQRPNLLVCDEPVSALDVSIQAQILDLLLTLQRDLGLAMLFISHDLAVIRQVADRVAVMKDGRIVETGPVEQVFTSPHADYTLRLLEAIPSLAVSQGHTTATAPHHLQP